MPHPKLKLRQPPAGWQCPYCLQPVGYVGRFFARLFGTGLHGCDFANVVDHQPPTVIRLGGGWHFIAAQPGALYTLWSPDGPTDYTGQWTYDQVRTFVRDTQ